MLRRLGPVLVFTTMGAAALFLVLWASMAGPVSISAHRPPRLEQPTPAPVSSSPTPSPSATPSPAPARGTHPAGAGWVGELVNVAVAIGFCLLASQLVYRWYSGATRRRVAAGGRPGSPAEGVNAEDVLDPTVDREAIRAGLAEQYAEQEAALTRLPPRNGIVQAWVLFEEAAGNAGVARARAETTTEFVVRLLHLLDVDPAAVGRLRALYVEARFSSHAVGPAQRDEARSALASIHDELDRLVSETSSSGPHA